MAAEDEKKEKEKDGKKEIKEKVEEVINAVYRVNLHCQQCARDISKPLMRTQGVHAVDADFEKGEMKVKGVIDPIKMQKRIEKLSKKKVVLVSPIVKPKESVTIEKKKEPIMRTTSVKVHMHCDKCEQDLKKRLLMHKGIHSVKTDMKAQTLTVGGTIEPDNLLSYLKKKVNKLAEIITSKQAEKKEEKKEKDDQKPTQKAGDGKPKEKPTEKSGDGKPSSTTESTKIIEVFKEADQTKVVEVKAKEGNAPYFIHYVYAPQLFSDENPNACSVM
ncbi:heavy metal-associated isoprenylated plant protein 4 [Juglans microcarpa x Juglans regia]|uniref:heavy metal-associated isoprenylated plant protein 4 n=1 Tax=Juglans microcarpa x Juglans regia TaxID=2249226 RepID=UPI001B7E0444|nr:heavy metal-associated isoprenylated plant protein 4 [Juglans microcarpa x Juglans regia]